MNLNEIKLIQMKSIEFIKMRLNELSLIKSHHFYEIKKIEMKKIEAV